MANKNFIYNIIINVKENINKQLEKVKTSELTKSFKNLGDSIRDTFVDKVPMGKELLDIFKAIPPQAKLIAAAVAGFGLAIWKAYEAIKALNKETKLLKQQFDSLNTDKLLEANARIQTLATNFEADSKDIVNSAKAMSKNLGIDLTEALNEIERGYINGADAQDNYLDSLKEYPAVFKKAGLSAKQFNNILIEQTKEGIFDDKAIDAYKTFIEEVSVESKGLVDAMKPLGVEFTKNLFKDLREGKIDTGDVMLKIKEQVAKSGLNEQEKAALGVGMFGSLSIEIGGLENGLNMYGKALNKTSDELSEFEKEQKANLELQTKLKESQDKLTKSFQPLASIGKAIDVGLTKFMIELYNISTDVSKKFFEWIDYLSNTAPVQQFSSQVKELWESTKNLYVSVWEAAKSVFGLYEKVRDFLGLGNRFEEMFASLTYLVTSFINVLQSLKDSLKYVFETIRSIMNLDFGGAVVNFTGAISKFGEALGKVAITASQIFLTTLNNLLGSLPIIGKKISESLLKAQESLNNFGESAEAKIDKSLDKLKDKYSKTKPIQIKVEVEVSEQTKKFRKAFEDNYYTAGKDNKAVTIDKRNNAELVSMNAHRAKLAAINNGIAQDTINSKLQMLDVERSIEDTKLEDLQARKDKELAIIKDSYKLQIQEANLAAEEMLRNAAGKSWGESFSKEERNAAMTDIRNKAAGGDTVAMQQLETINEAYARSAALRKQQEVEVAALKKKYADEEFEKQQRLKAVYSQIEVIRLDGETLRLKQNMKLVKTLDEQLSLNNQLFEIERRRLENERQAEIERLRAAARASGAASGTTFTAYDTRKRQLDDAIKKQEELKAALIKYQNIVTTDFSKAGNALDDLNKEFDRLGVTFNRSLFTHFGDPALVDRGTERVAQTLINGIGAELNRLNTDLRTLTTATLQQIANDAATFGAQMAAEAQQILASGTQQDAEITQNLYNQQIDIFRNYLKDRSDLIQKMIDRENYLYDEAENNQKGLRGQREADLKNSMKESLKSFNLGEFAKNFTQYIEQGFITEKAIMTERIEHLEQVRDLSIQLANNTVQDNLIGGFTDSGLSLEVAQQNANQLINIAKETGFKRADIEAKIGRKISDNEMANLMQLQNATLNANKEFMEKKKEIFMTDTELRLDRTKRFLEQAAEVGQAYVDVIGQVFDVMNQYTQAQIDKLSADIESLSEKLSQVNELISESENRLSEYEDKVDESRGKRKLDNIALYDKEREKLIGLRTEEAKLITQKKQAEEEQKQLQKESQERAEKLATLNQMIATTSMIAASAEAIKAAQNVPFPGNLIAAATSFGALVSLFATAKSVFKFEEGGEIPREGGQIKGNRHSKGGVPFTVKGSNKRFEAEGGEYIFSREAVNRIGLKRLNEMNFNRDTQSPNKLKFATGGMIGGSTTSPSIDVNSINERMDTLIQLQAMNNEKESVVSVSDINSVNSTERVRVKSSRF